MEFTLSLLRRLRTGLHTTASTGDYEVIPNYARNRMRRTRALVRSAVLDMVGSPLVPYRAVQ